MKQEGPTSRRTLVAIVPSPSSTQMQNEAANEISRLEFVRLPDCDSYSECFQFANVQKHVPSYH